ncbi:MAG: threonine--tRNA ligase, partial [Firmicutes bacterium]|nr:threonine--tRNA ligase [Bacillota bacterium]
MITVRLRDGSSRVFPAGTKVGEVLRDRPGVLAAKVNGRLVDLGHTLTEDARVEGLTFEDEEGRAVARHSAAHVMAQAVCRLFPGAKLGIGPAIADGFYYDFDVPRPLTPEDLESIEGEMRKIVAADLPFERRELSRDEALEFFGGADQPYKVELIRELPPDAVISCYRQGEFVDLCTGPHVPSTGRVGAVK